MSIFAIGTPDPEIIHDDVGLVMDDKPVYQVRTYSWSHHEQNVKEGGGPTTVNCYAVRRGLQNDKVQYFCSRMNQ